MRKILTDVKFWIISITVVFLICLLFIPFPSWDENLTQQKEMGQMLIAENLVSIEELSFTEAGYRSGWEINEGNFSTLTSLKLRAKIVNKSDKRLSLVRGKLGISFNKIYKSSKEVLPFEFGYIISPKSEKYYSTWLSFQSGDIFPNALLTDVNQPSMLGIDEVWAEDYFNPFDEIINYFREEYFEK
jgi:hypothetical protein